MPARALGLALLGSLPPGHALLIPRCRCVHTFGMRFRVDLIFLRADGAVAEVRRAVPPRRVVRCGAARHVVEVAAGQAHGVLASNILVPG